MSEDGGNSAAAFVAVAQQLVRNDDLLGALDATEKAVAAEPANALGYFARATILTKLGRFEAAVESYTDALVITPDNVDLLIARGKAYDELARIDEAYADFRRAVDLAPDNAAARDHLGLCLCRLGRHREGILEFEEVHRLLPDRAKVIDQLGERYLLLGRFDEGWNRYRWPYAEVPAELAPDSQSQVVIVRCLAGRGDVIQFVRLLPLFQEMGCRVILDCPPGLKGLLAGAAGIDEIYEIDEDDADFPGASEIHIMAVPAYFHVNLEQAPRAAPYLHADPALVAKWAERIAELAKPYGHTLKVGICWAGNPAHTNDKNRSATLSDFAPLAAVEGVLFFSLQVGYEFDFGLPDPPGGMTLVDIGSEIDDYADTAAVIENLDLIICVDTSVAHVAGAIGRPVWTLLPIDPDWRWLLDREDCPWYPSMRLFRQTHYRRWDTILPHIAEELKKLVDERSTAGNA